MIAKANKVALDGGDCVIVYIKNIFRGEDVFFKHTFLEPPGAVGVAEAAGRNAHRYRVEGCDWPMIGCDNPTLFGIDDLGQQLMGQDSLPIVVRIPSLMGRPTIHQCLCRTYG